MSPSDEEEKSLLLMLLDNNYRREYISIYVELFRTTRKRRPPIYEHAGCITLAQGDF